MTSLIDVIFLLLLFFMLSSTFSRFAEVEISAAAGGAAAASSDTAPAFLRLGPDTLSLNGQETVLDDLQSAFDDLRETSDETSTPVIVSLRDEVSSQRLTDLLVALRRVERVTITILGAT
ncbi:biopolymer transporter ExbD [Roseovarius indicus]|uniref:Biopolymer transporter ExbD n=1 Tax=Roseovarius indicus TaxID=540747 RepID=A0A0T5P5M1_9RHOB|nr:biopolymer transporter ExbD [Roseovarius indicus]KRS16406.1 biopolymer transporter ExbD [Roseovarius indicus]QEW28419.1 TonB system transport protein ExbD [Roseovarius indicus]SFE11110.1 outer membrane transport energization protein ExbD [Roseovarius indicus]